MNEWVPPENDALFQFECQVILNALNKMICNHCMEEHLPDGSTKGIHAVYTVYMGIKGIIPPDAAMSDLKRTFDLDDAGIVTLALQVDQVIIPQMKMIESAPEKKLLNDSIRSCFGNGFSWN